MAYKIAISQNKGGNHKTTLSLCLADALQHVGYKVLLIDIDAQANSTNTYGAKIDGVNTLVDVLKKDCKASEAIQHTQMGDIIPGDPLLAQEEYIIFSMNGRENLLKKALREVEDAYDFVVIDTPPNLGVYTKIALTCANGCIIPVLAEKFSLDGLGALIQTIREVKEDLNEDLKIEGVLLTGFDARKSMNVEVKEALPQYGEALDFNVFDTIIRVCQDIPKTQALDDENKSLFEHFPSSNAAQDYANFTGELLKTISEGK